MTATTAVINPVSCFGGSNGQASVMTGGGSGSYGILWSNGATTATAANLPTGLYTVTVTYPRMLPPR